MDGTIDVDTKKEFIKKQTCFSQFTNEEIEKLSSLFREKNYIPNQIIVHEGERVDSVFLIVKGTADVRHITIHNGQQQIKSVATLKEGDAIGLNETGFYSLSGVRTATVVALSNMVLLTMSVPQFHGFALEYSHVNELMRRNAESVLQLNTENKLF